MKRIYAVLPRFLRLRFWFIMLVLFVEACTTTFSVFIIAMFARCVSSPEAFRARGAYKRIISFFPESFAASLDDSRNLITLMCLLVIVFIVLKNAVLCFAQAYTVYFSEQVSLFIGKETFSRYLAQDYLWHISPVSKDMFGRIEKRAQLTKYITQTMQMFDKALCSIVLITVLFGATPIFAFIMAASFSGIGLFIHRRLQKRLAASGAQSGKISSDLSWSIKMITRGIREIIVYQKQGVFLDDIATQMKTAIPYKTFLAYAGTIPSRILEVLGFLLLFGMMIYMVVSGKPMQEIIGTMSLMLLTAWRVLPMISRCVGIAMRIGGIRPNALACLELLEVLQAPDTSSTNVTAIDYHFSQSIELKDVGFKYPGAKRNCLSSISLTIEKGESVGIIGKSGSGKTTLGMILAGLFPPTSGSMLLDGLESTSGILGSYRQQIGYVPQAPLLLPGTIADNIALSQWGEPHEAEKIKHVCQLAAMDFIDQLKGGINYTIGEGGDGLSGGQAQRVSIARALFVNPAIIIFDEATSSLDRASESMIEATVRSLRGNTTSIIIAHRLASLERCDRIIWLEKGMVKEVGVPSVILPRYDLPRS